MGGFFHLHFGGTGLIEEAICPPPGAVVIWADADKRTVFAAQSALKGVYPRCGTAVVKYQTDVSRLDPLFHPPRSASCPMDAAGDRAAVLARIGGDFSSVLREYASQLKTVQAVLCPPGLSSSGGACGLAAEAPAIVAAADGGVAMKGPIAIAAMASEIFLLESAEGMPADQVAWGRLQGDAALQDVLKTHRLYLDLMEKTRPIARQKGSNILAQIVTSLQDGHKFPGALPVAQPVRFGVLIGRDTNIANVAGLLNLGWNLPGYQANEVPPGSALAFELLRDVGTGQRYVRLAYFAQTPEQMRQATRLDLNHLPGMTAVDLPACSAQARNNACPVERFVEIARAAIDPGCVTIGK
jgi:4-phytase / acid phosphatase